MAENKTLDKANAILNLKTRLSEMTLEELIDMLPRQTYNCEPFGLMFMQTDGIHSKAYTCSYYSHFSKKSDDRIPTIKGKTIREAACKMFKWFVKNMPSSLK